MTDQEFAELLARGYELRGVEFKGPGRRSDKKFFARIARAVLGMANRRDGGLVIIGVKDDGGHLTPVALTDDHVGTWKYDDVAAALAEYADPTTSFDLELFTYNGGNHVVIHVHEFDDIPVPCKKDYNVNLEKGGIDQILRRGACYVRSRRNVACFLSPSNLPI